jgi:hypothetical protein
MNNILVQIKLENDDIYVVNVDSMEDFDDKVQFSRENDILKTKDGTRVRYMKIVSYKEMT